MAKNGISKLQLNKLVKTLPAPVQEHLKRCRKLAGYVVERVSTEDWFIEGKYKAKDIISAVAYHDIGKCTIPKDAIYFDQCKNQQKREKYLSHVDEAITLIEKKQNLSLRDFRANSYENTLFYAITEHHECVDGSGFPQGKTGNMLSFVGKLTAVIDAFDNAVFVGNAGKIDFDGGLAKLKDLAGKKLDLQTVKMLISDEETLRDFVSYINDREKDNRRKDRYGIQLRYYPIYNVGDMRIAGYQTDLVINDPYYGLLPSHLFRSVAEKAGSIFQLEKIGFEKLCINLEKLMIRGLTVPEVYYPFSARHIEKKNFFKDVKKILNKYEINPNKIIFMMSENSITDYCVDIPQVVNGMHELGVRFFINEFGEQISLLSQNEEGQIDGVFFKKEYGAKLARNPKTYSIVSGMLRIVEKLHADIVIDGIEDSRDEESVLKMGAKYASGGRYGKSLTDKELIDYVKQGGGLDG